MVFMDLPKPSIRTWPEVYSASNRNEYQEQKNNVSGDWNAVGA
jgi:hypothetical protein